MLEGVVDANTYDMAMVVVGVYNRLRTRSHPAFPESLAIVAHMYLMMPRGYPRVTNSAWAGDSAWREASADGEGGTDVTGRTCGDGGGVQGCMGGG